MKQLCLLLIFLTGWGGWQSRAQALVSFPEYTFAGERERDRLNGPNLVGSEFQSDVLAFTKPMAWQFKWLTSDKGFDLSMGSLGPKRLYSDNRIKLTNQLLPDLEFKLIYLDRADFEKDFQSLVFEFAHFWQSFGLALYGEASSRKGQDDIGGAMIWRWSDRHEWRIFAAWPDYSWNKRTQEESFYTNKPFVFGFVGRFYENKGDFVEYSFRWETPSALLTPSTGNLYQYRNKVFNVYGRYHLGPAEWLNYDVVARQRFETSPQGGGGPESWDSDQLDVLLQWEKSDFIWGFKHAYRFWRSAAGSVQHGDLLPHMWYTLSQSRYEGFQAHFQLGYEFTWHRGEGEAPLRSTLDRNNVLEHRLNLRYDLLFAKNTRFYIQASADLDEFGTGETWEGGNMQFQWLF